MESIKVREYKTYQVFYSPAVDANSNGEFFAQDPSGEVVCRGGSENKVLADIDRSVKRAFLPINAFHGGECREGRITSFNPEAGRVPECWFVDKAGQRQKITVYSSGLADLFHYSSENALIANEIWRIRANINTLHKQWDELKGKLTRITVDELKANLSAKKGGKENDDAENGN